LLRVKKENNRSNFKWAKKGEGLFLKKPGGKKEGKQGRPPKSGNDRREPKTRK